MNPNRDDGPTFVSDLIRDVDQLKESQVELEDKLLTLNAEHIQLKHQLEAAEKILSVVRLRENDLAVMSAKLEGQRDGRKNATMLFLFILVPLLVGFLSWWVPATLDAINHTMFEESQPDYRGRR